MTIRLAIRWVALTGLAALAVASAMPASSQTAPVDSTEPQPSLVTAEPAQAAAQPPGTVFREIDDAHTGERWLLIRNAANPAGPGRLMRMERSGSGPNEGTSGDATQAGAPAANAARLRPVIHAGDALIVEEHTAVVDARLEAVALGPAVMGAEFKARLKIGGKVVRVIALAKGRATLAPESESQP